MGWVRAPLIFLFVTLAAIAGVATAAMSMRSAVATSGAALAQAALDLGEAERLRSLRERVSRKARTYLFTRENRYLQELRASERAFLKLLATRRESARTPKESELVQLLEEHEGARRIIADRLIDEQRSGTSVDRLVRESETELQPVLDKTDATIARLVEHHQNNVELARAESERSSRAVLLVWSATGLGVLASILSSLALARSLKRSQGRAARTRRHLAAIVACSDDAVYSIDMEGRILTWNESARRIFGYEGGEVVGRHVSMLAPSNPADGMSRILAQIRAGEPIAPIETSCKAKDRRLVDLVLTISPIKDESGRPTSASTIARDVTKERRLRRQRDRFFDLSLDLVCIAGTDGYFKQLNPKFETVLGFTRAELLERPFLDFVHPDEREATVRTISKLSAGEPAIDFENRYRCKDASYRWLSWLASPEPDGTIYAIARDVTEAKIAQTKLSALADELRQLAVVDELTGLHNRRGFNILADQELARALRKREQCLFFFADVDGLKRINDELGHDAGDRAICAAAAVLRSAFRKSDIIARLGGDEFVILCTDGAPDDRLLMERVEHLLRRYNSTEPLHPHALAISIGSTTFDPVHQEPLDAILRRADKLMYEQKARRKAAARPVSQILATAANGSRPRKVGPP